MADNKGSSSNPGKSLVAHLDQNRALQQDRLVGSSSTAPTGAQSFRSRPSGPGAAALDAAFTEFTNQPSSTQLGQFATGPTHPITGNPGGLAFRHSANTGWADEFLHLRNQPGSDPRAMAAQLTEGNRFYHSAQSNLHGGQIGSDATPQAWSCPSEPRSVDAAQRDMAARQNLALGYNRFIPPTQQYTMYPAERITDDARLADNAEQAMEAAFAAYDQDFQGAMDGWMEAGGSGGLENYVRNIRKMEEMKLEDSLASKPELTTNNPIAKPEGPVSSKFAYDHAMMKHAGDIVTTLTNNGSDETKAKMSGSSFQGLMRAIASGKAAVVDDNFVDTSTGEIIDDLIELSGVNPTQESNATGNGQHIKVDKNGGAADNTDSKDKGKGKMKSLEEQEQEQEQLQGYNETPA